MQLSSEEHIYYVERFDRGVIAFDQLQMAEAIGEGKPMLLKPRC